MFKSEKTFSLFDFRRGLSRLLFRGGSDKDGYRNADMIFEDVYYLELPTILYGVEIVEIDLTKQLIQKFEHSRQGLPNARLFRISSMKQEFLVGSYTFVIEYNNLEHPNTLFDGRDPGALMIATPRKNPIEK